MSVAYYIVLNKEDVAFDTFVNGKQLAKYFGPLTAFCKKKWIKND